MGEELEQFSRKMHQHRSLLRQQCHCFHQLALHIESFWLKTDTDIFIILVSFKLRLFNNFKSYFRLATFIAISIRVGLYEVNEVRIVWETYFHNDTVAARSATFSLKFWKWICFIKIATTGSIYCWKAIKRTISTKKSWRALQHKFWGPMYS